MPMSDQEQSGYSKLWRWWKISWTVIRSLLYVLLVVLAFGKAKDEFENLVLCLLVLILQGVNWAHTTQLRLTVEEAFVNRRMMFTLLEKAGAEDTTEAKEVVDEAERNYTRSNPIYYVNMGRATIVYLVVLWKLFTTLIF